LRFARTRTWTRALAKSPGIHDLELASRDVAPGISLLRIQGEVDQPLGGDLSLDRPETWFHPQRPLFDENILECGIETLHAPGDASVYMKVRLTPYVRISSMVAFALGGRKAWSMDQLAGRSTGTLRLRVALWRDFPKAGQRSVVFVPLDDKGRLVEEWGLLKATALLLEPRGERTLVTQVRRLVQIPRWAIPLAAKRFFVDQAERLVALKGSAAFIAATASAAAYTIVSLRRCAKGVPLIPLHVDSEDWIPAVRSDGSRLPFCEYLQKFLDACDASGASGGMLRGHDLRIFSCLDGRQLVPYQAAVPQASWEHIWNRIREPFKRQQTAYRQLYGGASAPELTVTTEPRFVAANVPECDGSVVLPEEGESLEYVEVEEIGTDDDRADIPLRGPFIHFDEVASHLKRSNSDSLLGVNAK